MKTSVIAIGLSLAVLGACTARVSERGYVFDERDLVRLEPKVTTKPQVREIMGSPSTASLIEGESWFYISSVQATYAFFKPEEIERKVVAVFFDESGMVVDEVGYYGLEDGQIINLVERETPTGGRELTVLQQIFGNVGRFNAPAASQQRTGSPGSGIPGP